MTDIYQTGIFLTRFYQQSFPCIRLRFEVLDRIFVGAVFGPHHGEQAKLSEVWSTSHQFDDSVVFFFRQTQTLCRSQIWYRMMIDHGFYWLLYESTNISYFIFRKSSFVI